MVAESHPNHSTGFVKASASSKAFRIRITRSDLLTAGGNPRVMFKHLKMSRVARQDGTNLRTALGYNRQQIIDYINAEAQKVVDTGIEGIAVCLNGSVVSTAATTLDFTGSAVQSLVVNAGIATVGIAQTTGGGSSYTDSDVDTHVNVGTANTGDVLTYGGSDYQWSAPSAVLSNNSVVRGLVTGVGNTTLRLVMTDSSTIDIDASTLNTSASDQDINTRITKAVSFARTETTYLRDVNRNGASNNMWDAAFRTPGSTPLGMGSAADTHVSNDGNAQPFSQTLIFRNAGINTDRDSVLVGISDHDTTDILVSGVIIIILVLVLPRNLFITGVNHIF